LSTSEHPPDSPDDLKLSVLRNDLLSLLSLIYNAATKLSLSLKPSSPTYSAALPLLEDMDKHIAALLHCTRLFKADSFGAALRQEVIDLAGDVFEAAKSLLNSFSSTEVTNSRTGQGKAGEEYMIRTASLHAIIDRARSSNGLSDSNLSAVRKAWVQHRSSLEDGLQELTEMIEEAGTENAQKDDFEDGWDELGLDSGQKLGGIELARAKKVRRIDPRTVQFNSVQLMLLQGRCYPEIVCSIPQTNTERDARSILLRSVGEAPPTTRQYPTTFCPAEPCHR